MRALGGPIPGDRDDAAPRLAVALVAARPARPPGHAPSPRSGDAKQTFGGGLGEVDPSPRPPPIN